MSVCEYRDAISLNGDWQFAYGSGPAEDEICSAESLASAGYEVYPCTVPGNFELDLQANGLIDDPFFGMNIAKLRDYEGSHLWYFTSFDAAARPGYNADLVFEGLDCLADVFLNGDLIGSCDNALVEHSFNVDSRLIGHNELFIHIRPAVEAARGYEYPPGLYALGSNYESLYIRKPAHAYGWDIMPRAVSGGLWRPVTLRYAPVERLDRVFLETLDVSTDHSTAKLAFRYNCRLSGSPIDKYRIKLDGVCQGREFRESREALFDAGAFIFDLENPALWWPRGSGEPNLYQVTASLVKNEDEIDRLDFGCGIRTVALERTDVTDREGSGGFCFRVNGEKVFILGANWVPADAYHSRDVARIPRMLDMVEDLGCNMIRCWGGNVYENDLFFDICDRKGLMVWQDFAMACAVYPQDLDFRRRIEDEARNVVRNFAGIPAWSSGRATTSVTWCTASGRAQARIQTPMF